MLIQVTPDSYRAPLPNHAVPRIIRPLFECIDEGRPLTPTVRDIAHSMGFDSFSYSFSDSPHIAGRNRYVFTTLPPEWVEVYNRNDYGQIDIRVKGATESVVPLLWDWKSERGKSAVVDDFLDQMGNFGVRSGVAYVFHDRRQCSIAATLNSVRPTMDQLRRTMIEEEIGNIVLFIKAFHQFFMWPLFERLLPRQPFALPLSPREVDVYELAADGDDTETIAQKLGISKSTAQRHIDNGRAKLGASNRMQAIARALKEGQIVPRAQLSGAEPTPDAASA